MGMFLKEYDIYVGSFIEMLNLRFAPKQVSANGPGGVEEMAVLQKVFGIFARGRTFVGCVAVLGLGGFWNWETKNRWYQYLDSLERVPSDAPGVYGAARIVEVITENLASVPPSPMHFTSHDLTADPRVLVKRDDTPHFYLAERFITISLPMAVWKP